MTTVQSPFPSPVHSLHSMDYPRLPGPSLPSLPSRPFGTKGSARRLDDLAKATSSAQCQELNSVAKTNSIKGLGLAGLEKMNSPQLPRVGKSVTCSALRPQMHLESAMRSEGSSTSRERAREEAFGLSQTQTESQREEQQVRTSYRPLSFLFNTKVCEKLVACLLSQ